MEDEKVWGFIRSTVELAEERFGQRLGDLKNEIKAVRAETAQVYHELQATKKELKADLGKMEARLTENIQGRRQDIDAALRTSSSYGKFKLRLLNG